MHFDMCREPKSDHSYFKKSEYQAYFGAAKIGDSLSALQISFQTSGSLRGSTFTGYLLPSSFDDIAKEMLRADPQAAVRAFGTALQDFEVEKPRATKAA